MTVVFSVLYILYVVVSSCIKLCILSVSVKIIGCQDRL